MFMFFLSLFLSSRVSRVSFDFFSFFLIIFQFSVKRGGLFIFFSPFFIDERHIQPVIKARIGSRGDSNKLAGDAEGPSVRTKIKQVSE